MLTNVRDWPSNCQHLPGCDILDPVAVARKLATHLRLSERCDLIIAVTHMRLSEDMKVSQATISGVERVDLILGGHDHHMIRTTMMDTEADPTVLQQDLFDQNTDFAIVCVPHKFHVECCTRLAVAGVPILKEKPVAESFEEY